MSIDSVKSKAGMKKADICDIYLPKCKYTDDEYLGYGLGTLQTSLGVTELKQITTSGLQASKFDEPTMYAIFGGSPEIVKITIDADNLLTVTARDQFNTGLFEHSVGTSIRLIHSGEADGSCFGLVGCCSSLNNYDEEKEKLFRFTSSGDDLPIGSIYYNGAQNPSHSPGRVDPGVSIGKRAQFSFEVKDNEDGDLYCPYTDRRSPKNNTLFRKLEARVLNYFEGRKMVWWSGVYEDVIDLNNFIRREYLIDSFNIKNDVASFKGQDPLILTEDKKSKIPLASNATLLTGGGVDDSIDDSSTQITYKDEAAFYFGPAGTTVFVRIESELLQCTVLSDFVLTIDFRAAWGTEKKDHNKGSSIQDAKVYQNVHFVDILTDLFSAAKIPSRFIGDYSSLKTQYPDLTYTRPITKPTEVKKLVDEIVVNADITLWYDEEGAEIRIRKVSDVNLQPVSLNENDHIRQGSVQVTRKPDMQYTRASSYWAQSDATKESGEENYQVGYIAVNLDTESASKKGEVNEYKQFFNNWLTNSPSDYAKGSAVVQKFIDRSEDVPVELQFDIDLESYGATQGGEVDLGAVINVSTSKVCDIYGNNQAKNYQITSIKQNPDFSFRVTSMLYQEPISGVDIDFIINTNKENYDLSTEFSPPAGSYTVYIEQGVTIGSTSTSTPAFTTGSQAAGVSLKIINRGAIYGAGGSGGDGGIAIAPNPNDNPEKVIENGAHGSNGGPAVEVTCPCEIDTGSGAIFGGGGGAGGSQSLASSIATGAGLFAIAGNGGSGGAGYVGGAGGNAGYAKIEGMSISDTGEPGIAGSQSSGGTLAGVSGGYYGDAGDSVIGASGGLSGASIVDNGNNVTILSGSQGGNIRPAYTG